MSPVVVENHSVVFSDSQQPPTQCLTGKTKGERDGHMGQQLLLGQCSVKILLSRVLPHSRS